MTGRGTPGVKTELVAGVAAAAAFLGMTGFLGMGYLWLSAGLAVAVYFGVRLLVPSGQAPGEPKRITPAERLETLRRTAAPIRDGVVAQRVSGVCSRASTLLRYLAVHPMKSVESELAIGQYLDLSERAVQLYLATGAENPAGIRSREKLTELLDGVAVRFDKLYEKLAQQDDRALAGEIDVLNRTLGELDQVYSTIQQDTGD